MRESKNRLGIRDCSGDEIYGQNNPQLGLPTAIYLWITGRANEVMHDMGDGHTLPSRMLFTTAFVVLLEFAWP
jgi:hypothetical protein